MTRKRIIYFICLLLIVMLVCTLLISLKTQTHANIAVNENTSLSITDVEKSSVTFDNSFTLPLYDNVIFEENQNYICIKVQDQIIGGINKYKCPESDFPDLTQPASDPFTYLLEIGMEIDVDSLSAHMISTGLLNGWKVYLLSDTIDIMHNIFPYSDFMYDVWFDYSSEQNRTYSILFDSIELN